MKQEKQGTGGHSSGKDWTDKLRNRLADYKEPVPDNLWANIEAFLPDEEEATKRSPRTIPLWFRWAVAASFIGIIAGIGLLAWRHEKSDTSQALAAKPEKDRPVMTVWGGEIPIYIYGEDRSDSDLIGIEDMFQQLINNDEEFEESPDDPLSPAQLLQQSMASADDQSEGGGEKENESDDLPGFISAPSNRRNPRKVIRKLDEMIADTQKPHHPNLGFKLYASNGFGNQTNRNGVLMSQQMLANFDYDSNPPKSGTRPSSPVYLTNHEEEQKHYQPFSLGLTVNIPISSRFSLSSGAVYTRLHSDFTNVANSFVYQKQMTLHYIGIPLSAQYHIWQWQGLNVYATAGGQVDFNVKVRVETDGLEVDMKKDRPQWSVGGALGVQYNIIPQLGIYAEPGIKYYFDNGSHVHNYFKYKPTNFNLQLGIRVNAW